MKHTWRGSGPSVFNGFEGRVRHTLASHSGPFWATSWAWILLGFRCFACIVQSMFSGPWNSSQPRPRLPFHPRPPYGFAAFCWKGFEDACHRWCQAVALAFLHLSWGHQKATSHGFGEPRLPHNLEPTVEPKETLSKLSRGRRHGR